MLRKLKPYNICMPALPYAYLTLYRAQEIINVGLMVFPVNKGWLDCCLKYISMSPVCEMHCSSLSNVCVFKIVRLALNFANYNIYPHQ